MRAFDSDIACFMAAKLDNALDRGQETELVNVRGDAIIIRLSTLHRQDDKMIRGVVYQFPMLFLEG